MNNESNSYVTGLTVDYEHPYLGLESYKEEYKDYFFGRSIDTQQLLKKVQRNYVTVLSGKSGLGKTSLIKAGLMPKLRDLDFLPIYLRFNFDDPQEDALSMLKSSIYQQIKRIDSSLPDFKGLTLWEYFHKYEILNGFSLPVFIFDQFEELFTRGDPNTELTQRLITEITDLVENQIPVSFQLIQRTKKIPFDIKSQNYRILISLREDYLPRLETLSVQMPRLKISRYRIVQMTGDQALEAIIKPGKAIVEENEARFILQLIYEVQLENMGRSDVPNMEVEPFLLSLICYHINELRIQRGEPKISRELLKTIHIRNIIDEFYKQSISPLSYRAHSLLEEKLLTNDGFRKLQPKSDLILTGVISEQDFDYLINKRILRKEIWSGREHVELIHDILIPIIKERKINRQAEKKRKRNLVYAVVVLIGVVFISSFIITNEQRKLADSRSQELQKNKDDLEFLITELGNANEQANSQRDIAERQRDIAERQRDIAEQQRKEANKQTRIAHAEKDTADIQKRRAEEAHKKITQLYLSERERTIDRLEELKTLGEDEKWRIENIITNVATYLWLKGDEASLDTLIQLMKTYEEYIPYDYGLAIPEGQMTFVQDSIGWPLVLSYNPRRTIYWDRFTLYWQNYSKLLATQYGVPTTDKVQFKEDDNVPLDQMKLSAPGQEDVVFNVPWQEGDVIVTKNGIKDERLLKFFKDNEHNWILMEELKHNGPWYLVPKWTQPIFKVSGYSASPGESGMAVIMANKLLENPELLLNNDVVKLLLSQVYDNNPITVIEAFKYRNGIEGIQNDLIEMVKDGISLLFLDEYLDFLADNQGYSSEDASNWVYEASVTNEMIPLHHLEKPKNYNIGDINEQLYKGKFDRYSISNKYLQPFPKPKIRIYIGANFLKLFYSDDYKLTSELIEVCEKVRTDLYRKFGFTLPGIHFYDNSKILQNNEIRFELLNQREGNELVEPIEVEPDDCFEFLYNELYNRGVWIRINWITPDRANNLIQNFSNEFDQWLNKYYTPTDIKNILRSVLNPEDKEMKFYEDSMYMEAVASIPQENTIYHVEWLLKSLVFWLQTNMDYRNLEEIRDVLIMTQNARFSSDPEYNSSPRTESSIIKAIGKLNEGNYQFAQSSFKEAYKNDRSAAVSAFLQFYPNYISFDIESFILDTIIPGSISSTRELSNAEIRDLELFLNEYSKGQISNDYLNLLFVLLHNYQQKEFIEKADKIIERILETKDKIEWSLTQKYLIGYFLLKNNNRNREKPQKLAIIEDLLSEAINKWTDEKLGRIFLETIELIQEDFFEYDWSNKLLIDIAYQKPENFWVNYYTGNHLSNKSQYNYSKQALNFLDLAEKAVPVEDAERLLAWVNLARGNTYYNLAAYPDKQDWAINIKEGIKTLELLWQNIPSFGYGWPNYENVLGPLYNLYEYNNEFEKAESIVNVGFNNDTNNITYLRYKYFLKLTKSDIDSVLYFANKIVEQDPESLFDLSLAQILKKHNSSEYNCNRYFKTDHQYKDYIRLWLYYYLFHNNKENKAVEILETRWREIDSSSWEYRMENSDETVFREMLIGYFLGKVDEDVIFAPLSDEKEFEAHPFSKTTSFQGLRCEAYLYKALLHSTKGELDDYINNLKKAISTNFYSYYEYHLAKYLFQISQ